MYAESCNNELFDSQPQRINYTELTELTLPDFALKHFDTSYGVQNVQMIRLKGAIR